MTKRIIYGPILSRRLGRSLGIDIIKTPDTKKNCNFDCVYCQLGHVPKKITGNTDVKGLVASEEVIESLRSYHKNIEDLDYVTFSGTCEPTLNPALGEMIRGIKEINPHPICVITNSSLVDKETVRENLSETDLVVATLVSGYEETFRAINRPAKGIELENIINGLKEIRKMDKRPILGIEVMLVNANMDFPVNHTEKEIDRLKEVLLEIDPDEIEILTVSRPPAEDYIVPVPENRLKQIAMEFENVFGKERVKLVLKGVKKSRSKMKHGNIEEEVYDLIMRRPCTFKQISASLGINDKELKPIIDRMLSSQSIKENAVEEKKYYKIN
ncbi:radical SAM protein [Methanolobus bombayensis]|uniref:radical SAM protein n=1 Tax=Methanolobus bombayensis TaxID=38023 RepID=UPI001AE68E0D|nr:radical SAM protein [Methanolobus bombayensis]MBP1908752.1 wyosine [tRNA(Phe)-imidazoG37] synthetase (radical SAM superfamily) [Methanolobus bombayensis]